MQVSTKQQRIAMKARSDRNLRFTSLHHHMDLDWMYEAYGRIRKDGASGVDDVTAEEYEADLDLNLRFLLRRLKDGSYFAPPVKRAFVPKSPGSTETRPIGIPTLEDKVAQRAVEMLLSPIYEEDFLPSSYGFRRGRSAHDALQSVRNQIHESRIEWVLDVDVQGYFDSLDHAQLRTFLDLRVQDGVIRKLLHKWLKAGVMEAETVHYPETGTPQGGVISPLLSNLYLHEVLDRWFSEVVSEFMTGPSFQVRYADDFILGFRNESDARAVLQVLPKRFSKYGLTIHPTKTRLVAFERPPYGGPRRPDGLGTGPGSFDYLGFTLYWGRTRKGGWAVKTKTSGARFRRGLRRIKLYCRSARHHPLATQHRELSSKLRGHYSYFGVPGNGRLLERFRFQTIKLWRKWLNRRTRKRNQYRWSAMYDLLRTFPLPTACLNRSIQRRIRDTEEPSALIALARTCGGAGR